MTDFSVYLTSIGNDYYQVFIKNNRFLPLYTIGLTREQITHADPVPCDWVMYPNHPIEAVREELQEASLALCDAIWQLQARGIVEVTFITQS